MIEIYDISEFYKLGFSFFDLFDHMFFLFILNRDGYVLYNPIDVSIYDTNKIFCFNVKLLNF